jgi:two-component system cell cycle response regulator
VDEQVAVVAVVTGAEAVAPVLSDAGFLVAPIGSLDEVEVHGEGAPVAVVVRWPVRHVGIGELGVPVVALVDATDGEGEGEGHGDDVEAAIADAVQRGAHDVVLSSAPAGEVVARVRAAQRMATGLRQLQALSRTDELTGLSNRRHLDEHLEMMSAMARRQRSVFSLLLIDVDRTRRINAEQGHAAGDAVLVEIARRIVAGLRAEDVAGRWHGEAFIVLLPHTDLDGGWRLAERIRASVCDEPVALDGDRDVVVTVSIGCAEGNGADLEDHLERAQAAVDDAKAAGRNKVVAYAPI